MKNKFVKSLFSLLLLASSAFTAKAEADSSYAYTNECCWDECCWDEYCGTPSRIYVGPVYDYRVIKLDSNSNTSVSTDVEEAAENISAYGVGYGGKVKGQEVGVNAGYEYLETDAIYFNLDFTYTNVRLKGTDRYGSRLNEWNLFGRIGYTWGECSWTVTPYVGFGYWNDDFNLSCHTIDGNSRSLKYSTYYIPFGVLADYEVLCDFIVGLDIRFLPQVDSKLEVTGGRADGVSRSLDKKWGFYAELPLRWQICEEWGFEVAVVPFYEFNQFGGGFFNMNEIPAAATALLPAELGPTATPAVTNVNAPGFKENIYGAKFLVGIKF